MNFSGKFGSDSVIWYPALVSRYGLDGSLSFVGYYGNYWSLAPPSYFVYRLYFNSNGNVYPSSNGKRASGQSVRCLQE